MKKLLGVLIVALAINFLAVAGAAAWLAQSAHLDKTKLMQVRDLLFRPMVTPATQPSESIATAPIPRLDALLVQQIGRPASEQVEFMQRKFDEQLLQLDRRQNELADLKRQVDLANLKLSEDRKALLKAQQTLDQRQKEADRLQNDKGFQDSLALYNSIPSRQVKTIFMTLNEAVVRQYLEAMEPRNASKIIKEFKTPDETAFIQRILEQMRQSATAPAAGSPAAAGTASDQNQP